MCNVLLDLFFAVVEMKTYDILVQPCAAHWGGMTLKGQNNDHDEKEVAFPKV